MTERVKGMWISLVFNVAAVALNLALVWSSASKGGWMWPMNLVAALVSAYMIYWSYCKILQIKQEEKDRVIQILSGDFG